MRTPSSQLYNRQSIRLKTHDYTSPGAYFITICAYRQRHLFGAVSNGHMSLSPIGHAVESAWRSIPEVLHGVRLDAFVVMPNHVHGIVYLPSPPIRPTPLSGVVRVFKSDVTQWARNNEGVHRVWHRNYYERIVRDERALRCIRAYIIDNPAKWTRQHGC